jgi:uncharacterized protein
MKKKLLVLILAFLFLDVGIHNVMAQNYRMESIFLYNFTKYIQWESSTKWNDLNIAVIGTGNNAQVAKTAIETAFKGNIKVDVITTTASINNTYHVIYVVEKNTKEVKRRCENFQAIIVGDHPGGHFQFIEKNGRLSFNMVDKSLFPKGVKISGELIQMSNNKRKGGTN